LAPLRLERRSPPSPPSPSPPSPHPPPRVDIQEGAAKANQKLDDQGGGGAVVGIAVTVGICALVAMAVVYYRKCLLRNWRQHAKRRGDVARAVPVSPRALESTTSTAAAHTVNARGIHSVEVNEVSSDNDRSTSVDSSQVDVRMAEVVGVHARSRVAMCGSPWRKGRHHVKSGKHFGGTTQRPASVPPIRQMPTAGSDALSRLHAVLGEESCCSMGGESCAVGEESCSGDMDLHEVLASAPETLGVPSPREYGGNVTPRASADDVRAGAVTSVRTAEEGEVEIAVTFKGKLGVGLVDGTHKGQSAAVVSNIAPDSPAVPQGLCVGARLAKVNGMSVEGKSRQVVQLIIQQADGPTKTLVFAARTGAGRASVRSCSASTTSEDPSFMLSPPESPRLSSVASDGSVRELSPVLTQPATPSPNGTTNAFTTPSPNETTNLVLGLSDSGASTIMSSPEPETATRPARDGETPSQPGVLGRLNGILFSTDAQ